MSQRQLFDQHERAALTRRVAPDAAGADAGPTPHPLLTLQRQIGNARIARMLAQREGAPEEEEMLQASRDAAIQREAAPEEEEMLQASRDAAIQREAAPEEEEMLQASRDPAIQREGAPEEEEMLQASRDPAIQREAAPEEEEMLQAKADGPEVGPEGGPISDALAGRIQARRGGGASLDDGTRDTMEQNFGARFDDVRVHTDSESDALNRSVGAKAFTIGSDIFFRQDTSPNNTELLGHELTHVVQQRSMNHSGPLQVGPADDGYEREANAAAAAVTSGGPAPQRKTDEASN